MRSVPAAGVDRISSMRASNPTGQILFKGDMGSDGDEEATRRAAYYRHMAAQARAQAETMKDFAARKTMLEVARLWDGMAANAERTANSD